MENKQPFRIDVALLPQNTQYFSLESGLAVVIDTLRFTTSAITALANGARSVQTCTTAAEAFERRAADRAVLLCGERGGTKIADFDLGNSPGEYRNAAIAGRCLLFSTTNGTLAVEVAHKAHVAQIVLGALVNRNAVAQHAVDFLSAISYPVPADPHHTRAAVTLICAGTDGLVAGEDVLTAGAILDAIHDRWISTHGEYADCIFSDSAAIARSLWKSVISSTALGSTLSDRVVAFFHQMRGGAKLVELGFAADLADAAAIDSLQSLPVCKPSDHSPMSLRFADSQRAHQAPH